MVRTALAALVIALLLAACGGNVDGTATKQPPPTTDPSALDPGSYPTTPRPPLGQAGSDEVGRLIEGRRMASFVVGPWQADPELTKAGASPARVIEQRNQIVGVLWPSMLGRFPALPLIAGFVSERASAKPGDSTLVRNVVLQYPFPMTAVEAAEGLAAGALNVADHGSGPALTEPARQVPIPAHPEATAALMTRREGTAIVHELTVISTRGPHVLIQVIAFATPERATELAGRMLDLQVPLIDRFVPTEPAPLASLPRDPSGLLARTVPLKAGQGDSMSDSDYDPAGAIQLEDNPIKAGSAMQAAGVDTVATSQTTVYQARDADAAQQLAEALGDDTVASQAAQPAAGVPGLADSRCVRIQGGGGLIPQHWCIATNDRFTFKTVARELDNAHQQMAAQYLMLND